MRRIFKYNRCSQVWQANRGDFKLRIIRRDEKGDERYVCVAEFGPYLNEEQTRDFNEFQEALLGWFRGGPYQVRYRDKLLSGDVNPFETWEEIKRDYCLSNEYDVKKEEANVS